MHGAAAVLEGLAGEGRLQRGHHLGDALGPFAHGHAVHGELVTHVPSGHDEVDTSPAQVVEHHEVFGQAQRLVERGDESGRHEPNL